LALILTYIEIMILNNIPQVLAGGRGSLKSYYSFECYGGVYVYVW